jgi:AcrR family transcriptional regulator
MSKIVAKAPTTIDRTRKAAGTAKAKRVPHPVEAIDTRTRLVDAAEHCYARLGVNGTNMADIAERAAITRRTLYRYFANREQMLDAVVRREVERFWLAFNATQKKFDDLGTYLVEALVFTLKHAPSTNSHKFLFNEQVLPLVNKMYIDNRQHILERVAALQIIYDNHLKRGGIRRQLDLFMLCEWFNRLAVSYLAAPSPFYRTERELRELFSNMLLPIIADNSKAASKAALKPRKVSAKTP